MELTDEELEEVVGGTDDYRHFLMRWKQHLSLMEGGYGTYSMRSGGYSGDCPQGSQQIGFLNEPDGQGNPIPRCVRDGATINQQPTPLEEDFQDDVKKGHKKMKIRLLKTGGNKTKAAPFNQDPSMERSKSAPPGFGGS
tara:strand:- start:305 stop:721 length:417 start_codon:yes stop_codon:yes gene_type:complete